FAPSEMDVLLTAAPGIIAPDGSLTTPEMEPTGVCARSGVHRTSAAAMREKSFMRSPYDDSDPDAYNPSGTNKANLQSIRRRQFLRTSPKLPTHNVGQLSDQSSLPELLDGTLQRARPAIEKASPGRKRSGRSG